LKAGGLVIYRVLMGKHSTYTIEAIEDSELLLLTASARELMNALPVFELPKIAVRKRFYCFAIKSKLRFNRNC
jgi:hypothetical protein